MIPQHGTLEISRSHLRHNLALLRQSAGRARLCATIKANAYGHGIEPIAQLLEAEGVEWVCVYNLEEAFGLDTFHFQTLVLAPLQFSETKSLPVADNNSLHKIARRLDDRASTPIIRVNITSMESARQLSRLAAESKVQGAIRVHMQIDAGLTRAGIEPREAPALADIIGSLPHLALEGVFSHFSHGDEPGHPTLERQTATLLRTADEIKVKFPQLLVHIQNSGGAFHLQNKNAFDLARVGIALYGLQPSTKHPIPELLPIARLTAPILAIHDRPEGVGVGYGHTFVTKRATRLAIVPVGYADGCPRVLSNNCVAQIREVDVPLVGRVSMDQIILDITELPAEIAVGESVTVISGNPEKPNSLDRMADTLNTIGYEIATHLGARLRRVIVD